MGSEQAEQFVTAPRSRPGWLSAAPALNFVERPRLLILAFSFGTPARSRPQGQEAKRPGGQEASPALAARPHPGLLRFSDLATRRYTQRMAGSGERAAHLDTAAIAVRDVEVERHATLQSCSALMMYV